MPKSKRNKTVDLSKTKKHGLEGKKELYKKIQSNVENYAHIFVFAVNGMRNTKMKNVREQWKQSRFCIGKNKVMAMALGRTPEEEYRPNLHKIAQMLVGERGLLFTNQSVDELRVSSKLLSYEMAEFRFQILSVWSQDGSFANFKSDTYDPESKENATSPELKRKIDSAAILKLEKSAEKPKFSPRMTRARAAAENVKIKSPEPLQKRSSRKRQM